MPNKRTIGWACAWGGYKIEVYEGGKTIYTYSAGNSRHESQTYVERNSPNALPIEELRMLMKRTVSQLRHEFDVAADATQEDDDLAAGLLDELEGRWRDD